ncbi:MAG: 1,4-beta cellobiohydrolase [Chlorobi bacterium]|nr:1,4-beta cellobiohydrolase [Chlorobiota bacterium]
MELRKIVLTMLLASAVALIAGCQSDIIAPDVPSSPPINLQVSAVGSTSASLMWDAPADSANITGYRVWWTSATSLDSADVSAVPTRYNLTGITPGTPYGFAVATRRGALLSSKATLLWGGTTVVVPLVGPLPVLGLMASSISPTAVALRWTPQVDTGAITYRAAWKSVVSGDSGSIANTTSSSITVSDLRAGESYVFYIHAVRAGVISVPASIVWTGAARYGTTTPIRLYETQSAVGGSGLVLDPGRGGPATISTGNGAVGNVQLAMYTNGNLGNSFIIGASYSIVEYKNSDNFDRNTFISDSIYAASSLDAWLVSGPIDKRIPNDGNLRAFTIPMASAPGRGFFVRTGTPGDYHFVRVFIRSGNGMLLQGNAPDRYVELELSYQSIANIPYARAFPGWDSTPAVAGSQVRR